MSYAKDGEEFTFTPVKKVMDRMKGMGFIVDTFGFPKRDALVIKHGDSTRCSKLYKRMLKDAVKGGEKGKALAKSLIYIDVSKWDLADVNTCVEEVQLHPKFIEKYKINIPKNI